MFLLMLMYQLALTAVKRVQHTVVIKLVTLT